MLLAQAHFDRMNAYGRTYVAEDPEEYGYLLRNRPASVGLWSGGVFHEHCRRKTHWQATTTLAADLDTRPKRPLSLQDREAVHEVGRASGATLGYSTPHGARLVYCLERPIAHLPTAVAVGEALMAPLPALLEDAGLDLHLDPRSVLVTQTFRPPHDGADFEQYHPDPTPSPRLTTDSVRAARSLPSAVYGDGGVSGQQAPRAAGSALMKTVFEQWKEDNPVEFPPVGAEPCPVCHSPTGWGRLGWKKDKWVCFGSRHGEVKNPVNGRPVGYYTAQDVYFGDLLDILRFQTPSSIAASSVPFAHFRWQRTGTAAYGGRRPLIPLGGRGVLPSTSRGVQE